MVSDNLRRIKLDLVKACERSGRNPEDITIVAVTKYVGIDKIKEAIEAGIKHFGENRLQDALSKYRQIKDISNLHMVGHLQTNKVKKTLELFDMIQSLDSVKLAGEIDKHAKAANKVMDVLVQVNTSEEATKSGIRPEEAVDFIKQASAFPNIKIKGLMTIGPLTDNPENARPCFRVLKELYDKINQSANRQLTILSMGMSDDYRIAIEEGSNMIRIGRVLFQ